MGVDLGGQAGVDATAGAIFGGHFNDTLTGTLDLDIMYGRDGNDTLINTGGATTYQFGLGDGADTIQDQGAVDEMDLLSYEAGINYDQLWFRNVGNALEISVIGTDDKVTISNWYDGATNHVERIQVADGHFLMDSQVEQLVQAMAGMTPPPAGQTTLTAEQHQQLDAVLASSWQTA